MRFFALLSAVATTTLLTMCAADVDAGAKTRVRVSYCSDYDRDDCGSRGCRCDNTRDGNYASYSRWSCEGNGCEVCYTFDEPQDINDLGMAFYKGDERRRTFDVHLDNTNDVDDEDFEFTTDGTTESMRYYQLDSDETQELCIEAKDMDDDDLWFSVIEVRFMVD